MPKDLAQVVAEMTRKNYFQRIANNPAAQFGRPNRQYMGATILPNRNVSANQFREDLFRFRTLIANDTERYSPAQIKTTGVGRAFFEAWLGEQDVASQFTGQDYDVLLDLLNRNVSMEAMATIVNWVELTINLALEEKLEQARWQAIVNAQVIQGGDNNQNQPVTYLNPSGHRVAANGVWSNDSYDPWENDIVAMANMLRAKGRRVTRIITTYSSLGKLMNNAKVAERTSSLRLVTGGLLTSIAQRVTAEQVRAFLMADDLPSIETYDLMYNTLTGQTRFLPEGTMVFLCETGVDANIPVGETDRYIPDVLGYTAIGRGVGQQGSGRVIKVRYFDNKPPRLEAEGWQTSLPIITDPEAMAVISGIS